MKIVIAILTIGIISLGWVTLSLNHKVQSLEMDVEYQKALNYDLKKEKFITDTTNPEFTIYWDGGNCAVMVYSCLDSAKKLLNRNQKEIKKGK
jgi:hypothetical protein